MQSSVAVGGISFDNAVPVCDGSIVHHGKKLNGVKKTVSFSESEKLITTKKICFHNGKPISGKETGHYTMHLLDYQAKICLEICKNGCR